MNISINTESSVQDPPGEDQKSDRAVASQSQAHASHQQTRCQGRCPAGGQAGSQSGAQANAQTCSQTCSQTSGQIVRTAPRSQARRKGPCPTDREGNATRGQDSSQITRSCHPGPQGRSRQQGRCPRGNGAPTRTGAPGQPVHRSICTRGQTSRTRDVRDS